MPVLRTVALFIFLIIFVSDTEAQITSTAKAQSAVLEVADAETLSESSSENITHINSKKVNGNLKLASLEITADQHEESTTIVNGAEVVSDIAAVSENYHATENYENKEHSELASYDKIGSGEEVFTENLADDFENLSMKNYSAASGNFETINEGYESQATATERGPDSENYQFGDDPQQKGHIANPTTEVSDQELLFSYSGPTDDSLFKLISTDISLDQDVVTLPTSVYTSKDVFDALKEVERILTEHSSDGSYTTETTGNSQMVSVTTNYENDKEEQLSTLATVPIETTFGNTPSEDFDTVNPTLYSPLLVDAAYNNDENTSIDITTNTEINTSSDVSTETSFTRFTKEKLHSKPTTVATITAATASDVDDEIQSTTSLEPTVTSHATATVTEYDENTNRGYVFTSSEEDNKFDIETLEVEQLVTTYSSTAATVSDIRMFDNENETTILSEPTETFHTMIEHDNIEIITEDPDYIEPATLSGYAFTASEDRKDTSTIRKINTDNGNQYDSHDFSSSLSTELESDMFKNDEFVESAGIENVPVTGSQGIEDAESTTHQLTTHHHILSTEIFDQSTRESTDMTSEADNDFPTENDDAETSTTSEYPLTIVEEIKDVNNIPTMAVSAGSNYESSDENISEIANQDGELTISTNKPTTQATVDAIKSEDDDTNATTINDDLFIAFERINDKDHYLSTINLSNEAGSETTSIPIGSSDKTLYEYDDYKKISAESTIKENISTGMVDPTPSFSFQSTTQHSTMGMLLTTSIFGSEKTTEEYTLSSEDFVLSTTEDVLSTMKTTNFNTEDYSVSVKAPNNENENYSKSSEVRKNDLIKEENLVTNMINPHFITTERSVETTVTENTDISFDYTEYTHSKAKETDSQEHVNTVIIGDSSSILSDNDSTFTTTGSKMPTEVLVEMVTPESEFETTTSLEQTETFHVTVTGHDENESTISDYVFTTSDQYSEFGKKPLEFEPTTVMSAYSSTAATVSGIRMPESQNQTNISLQPTETFPTTMIVHESEAATIIEYPIYVENTETTSNLTENDSSFTTTKRNFNTEFEKDGMAKITDRTSPSTNSMFNDSDIDRTKSTDTVKPTTVDTIVSSSTVLSYINITYESPFIQHFTDYINSSERKLINTTTTESGTTKAVTEQLAIISTSSKSVWLNEKDNISTDYSYEEVPEKSENYSTDMTTENSVNKHTITSRLSENNSGSINPISEMFPLDTPNAVTVTESVYDDQSEEVGLSTEENKSVRSYGTSPMVDYLETTTSILIEDTYSTGKPIRNIHLEETESGGPRKEHIEVPYVQGHILGNFANVSIKIEVKEASFYVPSDAFFSEDSNRPILNISWASSKKFVNNSLCLALTDISRFYFIKEVQLNLVRDGELEVWKQNVIVAPVNDTFGKSGSIIQLADDVRVTFSSIDFLRMPQGNAGAEPTVIETMSAEIGIAAGCILGAILTCAVLYAVICRSRQRTLHIEHVAKHDISV